MTGGTSRSAAGTRAALIAIAIGALAAPAGSTSRYPFDPAPVLDRNPRHAAAGEYRLDLSHTSVTVRLSHMGLSFYTLRFDRIGGHYTFDPAHPTASQIAVEIDPASIDTGNPTFDAMIAKIYFQTSVYPTITFTSDTIRTSGHRGTIAGTLDLHGVRKPIVLHVNYRGFYGAEKPERMGFSASGMFKRSDFGVDPNVPAEGDEATITIEVEFKKV